MLMFSIKKLTTWLILIIISELRMSSSKKTIKKSREFLIKLLKMRREESRYRNILTRRKDRLMSSRICWIKFLLLSRKSSLNWQAANLIGAILIEFSNISTQESTSMTPTLQNISLNLKTTLIQSWSIREKQTSKQLQIFMQRPYFLMNFLQNNSRREHMYILLYSG